MAQFASYSGYIGGGSGGSGVSSLNGLTGGVTLAPGTNITIVPTGNTLTINSTGTGGANTALSNLVSTAVNADINPGAPDTINLGSATNYFSRVSARGYDVYNSSGVLLGGLDDPPANNIKLSSLAGDIDLNSFANISLNPSVSASISAPTGGNVLLESADLGAIQLADGSQGTAGYVWTSVDTVGGGSWLPASGSGANTALSNLITTSINQSLIPNTDVIHDLGSSGVQWGNLWAYVLTSASAIQINAGTAVTISGGSPSGLVLNTDTIPSVDNTYRIGTGSFKFSSMSSYNYNIYGAVSGSITLSVADTTTPYQILFPNAQGAAGNTLQNDGAGNLSWVAGSGSAITSLTGDVTATGPGAAAATLASVGTAGTYVKVTTDAKGRVTSGVTSPQAIADGGTGQTTANAGFAALSPMTTNGDLITRSGGVPTRLAIGTSAQVLTVSAGAPVWQTPTSLFFSVVSISTTTSAVSGKTYLADTSGAAFTVTLPAPVLNAYVVVKDSTGSFATNNLTVAPNGGEKIEGIAANQILITNWQSVIFLSNGTDWFML